MRTVCLNNNKFLSIEFKKIKKNKNLYNFNYFYDQNNLFSII